MISFARLSERSQPLVIAHRGASAEEHENTLLAFKRAIAVGADAIETDVRRTVDGILVVHHDRSIRPSGPPISRLTYKNCLQLAETQGYHLPTLKETLELCSGNISLDIELKEPNCGTQLAGLVRKYYHLDHVCFTSFRIRSLVHLRQVEPKAITGLLTGFVPRAVSGDGLPILSLQARLRQCGANFLAPDWRLLRFGMVSRVRKLGIPMIPWTVNRSPSARRLARLGAAGIITDYPDRIISALTSQPHETRRPRLGRRWRQPNL